MAKVYKSHKSNSKYSFQKKHLSAKTWLIIAVVVVLAAIGLKICYDNYVSGEFEAAAPSSASLNTIATNWEKMSADAEKFQLDINMYYQYNVVSYNYESENGYLVQIMPLDTTADPNVTEVTAQGGFFRTTLSNFINGYAPWGQKTNFISASNANIGITVYGIDTDVTDATVTEVLAELEAIATAPVVEEPAEDAAEAPETPAE